MHLRDVEAWLQEGPEAEIQLGQLGQVAEPSGQLPMPPWAAWRAGPDMPGTSVQVYGQAAQRANSAQAIIMPQIRANTQYRMLCSFLSLQLLSVDLGNRTAID